MKSPIIYVMRHAEKPVDAKDSYLSAEGHERSIKFAAWFLANEVIPDCIFASTPSIHSQRPYQTVAPLGKHADELIDMRFSDDEYDKLASLLTTHAEYVDKAIVVCWHHGRIPHLMHELGAAADEYPDRWDDAVFNLILKVEYCAKGNPRVSYINMPF